MILNNTASIDTDQEYYAVNFNDIFHSMMALNKIGDTNLYIGGFVNFNPCCYRFFISAADAAFAAQWL